MKIIPVRDTKLSGKKVFAGKEIEVDNDTAEAWVRYGWAIKPGGDTSKVRESRTPGKAAKVAAASKTK